ncbi:MAG TPA: MFS transporter [Actinomycetota bacterium]|nr:MFS transporter [Actinomycetota bacterium]
MSDKLVTPPTTPPPGETTEREAPFGRIGIARPLRIRDFRLLWTGLTVSLIGDGLYVVALAWQAYELSNVPTAFSLVSVAWSLPMVAFLLVGGVISDRVERRRVLIASDIIRGVAIAGMGLLALAGVLQLWHLIVLAAFYGIGQALFGPAFGAIVPDIVPSEDLVQANSLDNFVRPLGERLAGPAIGGLIVAAWGAGWAFVIDAGTFVVSAIAIWMMSRRPPPERAEGASVLAEVREGLRFVRTQPWLWATLGAASISLLFVLGPFEVLVPFLIKNKLNGDASDVGFVFAAGGLGAVVAAFLMGQRGLPRKHILFLYLGFALGVSLMWPYAFLTTTWQAALVEFLAWGGWAASLVVWSTLMHRLVPTALLGRVTSLDWLVSISLTPVSFALVGPVSEAIGLDATFIWSGILGGIGVMAFLLVPGVRDTERDGTIHPLPSEAVP